MILYDFIDGFGLVWVWERCSEGFARLKRNGGGYLEISVSVCTILEFLGTAWIECALSRKGVSL